MACRFATADGALQRFRPKSALISVTTLFHRVIRRTALSLVLRALHAVTPERDEVILPAYTCPSLGKVILDLDLRPRLVDLSPQTLRYEPEVLIATLNDATLAVIVVHPACRSRLRRSATGSGCGRVHH